MKTQARIATYRRLRDQPLWRLLAADHAPEIIGLLQSLLLDGERRLPASILHERLQHALDHMDRGGTRELVRPAQAYVADWLAQGWLERRLHEGAHEEDYELSSAAILALRFVAGLDDRRSTATETRLSLVIDQLVQLAEATEPDPAARLAALEAERAQLDARIAEVVAGKVRPLDPQRALERAREAIRLADELAEDFRRVRDDMEQLNRDFRERIIDDEGERGDLLAHLFEGVDVIAESEAGRSFNAFWTLLNDMEQSAHLDAALDAVLSRGFARRLERHERQFLRGLTRVMLDRGGQVHDVMQHFARSLRSFVQSRGYLEQRRLNQLLKQAQAEALAAREHARPRQALPYALQLTTTRLRSLAQYRLHDPRLGQVDGSVSASEGVLVSLDSVAGLVAQSEIDFRGLRQDVFELLADHEALSIAGILAQRPATQGLGTIVGLLTLAGRHGVVDTGEAETVHWQGQDGRSRRARVAKVWFTRGRRDELV